MSICVLRRLSSFFKNQRGFSLTELAVVIIIGSVMMMPIYSLLYYVTDLKPTDERMEIIQEALAEHLRVTGTLPCPADPTLNMDTDDSAYVAAPDSSSGTGCDATQVTSAGGAGGVYIGAVPITDLRYAVGCTEPASGYGNFTDDVKTAVASTLFSIQEVISSKNDATANKTFRPHDVRCILREYLLDEFDRKFVYVVSANAVDIGFKPFEDNGQVDVRNVLGASTGATLSPKPYYLLISLGADNKGGYLRDGSSTPCGTSGALDEENCDDDNDFLIGIENTTDANYFDDRVDYGIARFMTEDSYFKWDKNTANADERDVKLDDNTILVINPLASGATVTNSDAVIVNNGAVSAVSNTVTVNNYTMATPEAATSTAVNADHDVNADQIIFPKYKYDTPLVP